MALLVGLRVWVLAYGAITLSKRVALVLLVLLVVSRLLWHVGIRYDSSDSA